MASKKTQFIKHKIIQICLALILLACGSYLIQDHYFKKQDLNLAKQAEAEMNNSQTLTTFEAEIFDPSPTVNSIENYLKNLTGEYGYFIVDLATGKSYGARQHNRYFMASTYKVAVSAYLAHQIELGKINPEKKLIYEKKFYEEGAGILFREEPGKSYKISYLNELMIRQSDNVAANMLLNYLGTSNIQQFLDENGLYDFNFSNNTTTPKDMSLLLQKIYNHEIISEISADQLFYLMINSINDNRLVAGVAPNIIVAHKIGTYNDAINDVGIVYLNERPYAVSIYSKKIDRPEIAEIVLASISKQIFKFQNSL